MKLAVNLDTLRVSETLASPPLAAVELTRGDALPMEVTFFRGTTPELLPSGTTLRLGVKAKDDFDGDFVASLTSWSLAEQTYSGTLNLNTTQAGTTVGESANADISMELAWDLAGAQVTARAVPGKLLNDVNRGDEGVVADGDPIYPPPENIVTDDPSRALTSFVLKSPDDSVWEISIADNGTLVRTKLT